MTTHEREITEPVLLALPDGRHLNPNARGWSRTLLQTANQRGTWGRKKRWDYWSIQAGDLIISGVVAHLDFFGTSDIWWIDLGDERTGGRGVGAAKGTGFEVPDLAGSQPIAIRGKNYSFDMRDDEAGNTYFDVVWTEENGEPGELHAVIEMPSGHETLNVVIPWSETVFQFTSKHQARPARGEMRVGDRHWLIGADDNAWGIIDIGRGRWPYDTTWNWGGGAGRAENGSVIGVQIGAKWTEGTGATENGIFVDGRLSKIGRELEWMYEWNNPMQPWRVVDPGGQLDITLVPRYDKYSKIDAKVMMRETHQVFGLWHGWVKDDNGQTHEFHHLQGFAEECRARW